MSKYVKSYKLKLDEDKSFGELICDYPKYVDIEQADETSVSIKLMDEAGKLHHVNFIARTELRQQDGLTSTVCFLDEPILDVHHEIEEDAEKFSVTFNMRLKAMWCCMWFGTMPYRVYEKKKHYRRGYWKHLKLNWGTVWMWLTHKKVTQSYVDFEKQTNTSWKRVFINMFGGLR